MAVSPISFWMRATSSTVLRRVEPPAPQVTDTNDGRERPSARRSCGTAVEAGVRLRREELERDHGRSLSETIRDAHDFSAGARAVRLKATRGSSDSIRSECLRARAPPCPDLERSRPLHGGRDRGRRPPEERVSRAGLFVRSADLPRPGVPIALQFEAPTSGRAGEPARRGALEHRRARLGDAAVGLRRDAARAARASSPSSSAGRWSRSRRKTSRSSRRLCYHGAYGAPGQRPADLPARRRLARPGSAVGRAAARQRRDLQGRPRALLGRRSRSRPRRCGPRAARASSST